MKITSKILSIPPYLSTSWYDVDSLFQSDDGVLVVAMANGTQVRLENLSSEVVHTIFDAHERFLEEEAEREEDEDEDEDEEGLILGKGTRGEIEFSVHAPLMSDQFDERGGDAMKIFMEHDPSRSLGPLLPEALLKRITSLAKMFLPQDMIPLDASHENCRCPFCQIVRALSGVPQPVSQEDEDKSADLQVTREKKERSHRAGHEKHKEGEQGKVKTAQSNQSGQSNQSPWIIQQMDDQLYTVTERAHPDQVFHVSLGTPVTCSCGQPNCVHIVAVLKS